MSRVFQALEALALRHRVLLRVAAGEKEIRAYRLQQSVRIHSPGSINFAVIRAPVSDRLV